MDKVTTMRTNKATREKEDFWETTSGTILSNFIYINNKVLQLRNAKQFFTELYVLRLQAIPDLQFAFDGKPTDRFWIFSVQKIYLSFNYACIMWYKIVNEQRKYN